MREEKFDASVPVWVEIVPTVMEFEVIPGAFPADDAAPAPAAGASTVAPDSPIPVSAAVAVSSLIRWPDRIPPPITCCDATPSWRSL